MQQSSASGFRSSRRNLVFVVKISASRARARLFAGAIRISWVGFAGHTGEGGCCKKYVVLCYLCGGLSAAVGSLFLAVHAILSAHTDSLALFETVPSYIPGIMVRDKNRSVVLPNASWRVDVHSDGLYAKTLMYQAAASSKLTLKCIVFMPLA